MCVLDKQIGATFSNVVQHKLQIGIVECISAFIFEHLYNVNTLCIVHRKHVIS